MPELAPQDLSPVAGGPSEAFADALRDEYKTIIERVSECRERADLLRRLADQADDLAIRQERYLREIEGLLGIGPQLRFETISRALRGQRLREVAVEVLSSHLVPGEEIHYREWYELLVAAGHHVGGKDPVASFLAQVTRADEVERVAPRSGRYRLRAV
jgi:hypothetical protein